MGLLLLKWFLYIPDWWVTTDQRLSKKGLSKKIALFTQSEKGKGDGHMPPRCNLTVSSLWKALIKILSSKSSQRHLTENRQVLRDGIETFPGYRKTRFLNSASLERSESRPAQNLSTRKSPRLLKMGKFVGISRPGI